jgi:hypothetical protein
MRIWKKRDQTAPGEIKIVSLDCAPSMFWNLKNSGPSLSTKIPEYYLGWQYGIFEIPVRMIELSSIPCILYNKSV